MIIKTKKKILIILAVLFIVVGGFFALDKYNWNQAVKAVNGSVGAYQIGLVSPTVTECQTSCCSPAGCRCCIGGTLCTTILTEAQCVMYSDVFGSPAGGMGSNALFLNTSIAMAGLTSGTDLIAAGMSPTMMDGGVLATAMGCSGCVARVDFVDKVKNWFGRVFIAGFKK